MLQRAINFDRRSAMLRGGLLASAALTASLVAATVFQHQGATNKPVRTLPSPTAHAPRAETQVILERPSVAPAPQVAAVAAPVFVPSASPPRLRTARLSFSSQPLVRGAAVRLELPPFVPLASIATPRLALPAAAPRPTHAEPAPSIVVTAPRSGSPTSDAYVEQLGRTSDSSVQIAQLSTPIGRGGDRLAERTAAMQVLPALNLGDGARERYLALAPEQLTLRIGESAAGKIAVAMGEDSAMSVQLAGLLDALSERLGPAQFERLRSSSAADSFVTLDELRAAGIALSYDAVYDELRLAG